MRLHLFISSTSDLKAERQALAADLSRLHDPYLYEDAGAGGVPPEDVLKEEIENSDVFIALLGPRYGSPYNNTKSIVEWEFETARSRETLPVMPFRKIVPADQIEPPQRQFIERLSAFGEGGTWLKEFDSPQTLVQLVRESLERWMIAQIGKVKARTTPWLQRALALVAVTAIVLCVVAFVLFMAQVVPLNQSSVFGVCGLTFFVILLVILLHVFNGR